MIRTGFRRPTLERVRTVHKQIPEHLRRGSVYARANAPAAPVEKENLLQHAGYMNAVRSLPCAHCGKGPRSVFCHSDEGKGAGIKSDCRNGWPGCHECHDAIGTRRIYDKAMRRALEAAMAKSTRKQIQSLGLWPKTLPLWTEA